MVHGGQVTIGGPGTAIQLSIRNINGVTETTCRQNGKTVKVQEGAQGIKIEVMENENDKDLTRKYSAKDVVDLKNNHPAGYEIYRRVCGEKPEKASTK